MHGIDLMEPEDDGTVFRDIIMLALLGFVTIVILILPHLNPPTPAEEAAQPPGNLLVEVRWPDEIDADVDLWVEAPGDRPVGYSNKGGDVFDLLRDDLGHTRDATGLNYEVAYSRGAPAGEYTINLHLYRNNTRIMPLMALVQIRIKREGESAMAPIATREVELRSVGEELTVVRFTLDEVGRLVLGSQHDVPRALRRTSG